MHEAPARDEGSAKDASDTGGVVSCAESESLVVCVFLFYATSSAHMFSEFFCKGGPTTVIVAWGGLLVVVGYSMFMAWIKAQINDFYSDFYDLMQASGNLVGDFASGSGPTLGDYRAQVWEQLARFARIVAPLVSVAPAAKWARSAWAFAWRAALMKSYLKAWDISKEPIEGASQRLHEDTQRFCAALQGCVATLLDAVFTLAVFTPILFDLSKQIAPPVSMGPLRCMWLWLLAFAAAVIGLGGAAFFGQKLVDLEVNNQRVEAAYRKDLVLLETTPAVIVGIPCRDPVPSTARVAIATPSTTRSGDAVTLASLGAQSQPHAQSAQQQQQTYAPWLYFAITLQRLRQNYHALFRHFTLLNYWLTLFDQTMVIFPYLVAAPLLFADDPTVRITLGTLVKMSNSFDKVFGSLSIISENWGAVNEFRSVLRRLREFETKLYFNSRPTSTNCLLPSHEASEHDGDGGGSGGGSGARRRSRRGASRSESLRHVSHTRTNSDDDAALPHGCAISSVNTELVVVEGGPVSLHTTYGEGQETTEDGDNRYDSRFDMHV